MTAAATTARRTPSRLARDVLGVFKLRIGLMIMLTALVGYAFTPGPGPGLAQVIVLALAVFVSSASAGAFNQYVEAESDRLMARTRGRAFVTGALPHSLAGADRRAVACRSAPPGGARLGGALHLLGVSARRPRSGSRRTGSSSSAARAASRCRRRRGRRPGTGCAPLLLALSSVFPPHFWSPDRQPGRLRCAACQMLVSSDRARSGSPGYVRRRGVVTAAFTRRPVYLAGAAAVVPSSCASRGCLRARPAARRQWARSSLRCCS
jgi:hypothetical protein